MLAATVTLATVLAAPEVRAATDAGICARCHESEAVLGAAGGHAPDVDCQSCHADRRPGRVGRRHRTTPRCTTHHTTGGHPSRAAARAGRKLSRNCVGCHDPHGSSNLALVPPAVRTAPRRLRRVAFSSEAGAAPGGFTDPAAPGTGVCETCHRRTDFFRADGRGRPHFPDACTLCHEHEASFAPVVAEKNCTICHAEEGARLAKPSLHAAQFSCSACHAEASPDPGPGHRRAPACAECHTNRTHAPRGTAPLACTACHDPHGTDNAQLVLDQIRTPAGQLRPIRFDNLLGRVDGSFASASAPGTGICEVCHTQTLFYTADGTGADHFTFSCLPCHLHAGGFEAR
jgi:predicted CXXCH cytochrome family protein